MAENNQIKEGPLCLYKVKFVPDLESPFQDIAGIEAMAQPVMYRSGNSPGKTPSPPKAVLTLKKGVFSNDTRFWEWYNSIRMNTAKPDKVEIYMQDQLGNTVMTWLVKNALIIKIQAPDLNAKGNDIAIESLELAHEGIEIKRN
ncbi:phage tail protein [Spirosoma aerolatum]|uniref:phage tail protein n=1 Tax=Spirosoma aerolatum TaxID=1211326 RepID=UPI0009AF111D|nr:phage tail protein [Spirosoma aerolatum]